MVPNAGLAGSTGCAGRVWVNDCQAASWSGVAAAPDVSKITKAGSSPELLNCAAAFAACTDSAPVGRNDSWSLDCTLDSDPMAGPPRPAMPNHATTTAISPTARSTALRRPCGPEPVGEFIVGDDGAEEGAEESAAVLCDPGGMAGSILLGRRASSKTYRLPTP